MASACPFHVDLTAPEVQEDWYPVYDRLRELAPVYRVPETGEYLLTRYEDIRAVLADPEAFPNHWTASTDFRLIRSPRAHQIYLDRGWERYAPLSSNPPVHRYYRRPVDKWFNWSGAKQAAPLIRRIVDELIDSWIDRGRVEFVSEFADTLPIRVITHLIGLDEDDIPQLKEWSAAWARPFARNLTEEQEIDVAEQGVAFQHYIYEHLQERRRNPREDFLSYLAQASFEGDPAGPRPLTDAEIVNSIDHLFIGGNETTTYALTSGLWMLIQQPEVEQRLRADRDLLPTFINENMRLESPTQGLWRGVARDTTIGGVDIPAGATLHLRYAAGNRDPRAFTDPTELQLDRRNAGQHIAFAAGAHRCPGEGLSKLEQQIAFERLFDRLTDLGFVPGANDFRHHPGFVLRALKELHVQFTPADQEVSV